MQKQSLNLPGRCNVKVAFYWGFGFAFLFLRISRLFLGFLFTGVNETCDLNLY